MEQRPTPAVYNSVEEVIGNTPLVRLNRLPQSLGIKAKVYAKCEFLNPGGSVKDRIGQRMIVDAEKSKRIKKGDTLIEATSGNTGIGLALCASLHGYQSIITLPEKMSQEKVGVLTALGAKIIRTPTEAAYDSPESHIGVALKLKKELQNSDILDQYKNNSNPNSHEDGTGEEIYQQLGKEQKCDIFVGTVGTGGTITGVSKRLKHYNPNCVVVGVDPLGSILAVPDSLNLMKDMPYKVEGIGYDFIPDVLDRSFIDRWVKTLDEESFFMSRRIIREEGLLVGGSSGSAMIGVFNFLLKDAPEYNREDVTVVVLFADSVRNYMTKFLRDKWMLDNGFGSRFDRETVSNALNDEWNIENRGLLATTSTHCKTKTAKDVLLATPPLSSKSSPYLHLSKDLTIGKSLEMLKGTNKQPFVVLDKTGEVKGVTNETNLLQLLGYGVCKQTDNLSDAIMLFPRFQLVEPNTTVFEISKKLENKMYLVVKTDDKKNKYQVLSHVDVLRYACITSKL